MEQTASQRVRVATIAQLLRERIKHEIQYRSRTFDTLIHVKAVVDALLAKRAQSANDRLSRSGQALCEKIRSGTIQFHGSQSPSNRSQPSRANVRFRRQSGHDADAQECLLLTQSGQWPLVTKGIAPRPQFDILLSAGSGPHDGGKPWSGGES